MGVFTFLSSLMSIVGGGISVIDAIKSNRSFDDEIRIALGKVTNDDFQRKRLITLSSDILHFAVRKLNNEKIILPPDIDEKEFNDFFNKVTKNKQTWFYLDEQLKNYKLANINNKLEFIKNDTKKIDSIIVKSDHIFENTEELGNKIDNLKRDAEDVSEVTKDIKTKLSVPDWLRPYEKELSASSKIEFLDDASENLIREGKVYRNNSKIQRIKDYLDINKKCLIKAPEGRGKTYLSRIIAYDYYHDQRMEVYFVEFKDNGGIPISKIDDQLQVWNKNIEKNYLLILENCHAYQNLEGLSEKINTLCRTDCNNIRFLLNARPTDEGMDYFSEWKTMNLEPDATDLEGIINLYSQAIKDRNPFDTEKNRDDFIKEKILPKVNSVNGANLRLLNIYLKTWQNHPEKTYISDIDEPTILKDFIKRYKLEKVTEEDIKVLHYISCIYQFDVPFHIDLIPNGRSNSLQNFKGKGLLRKVNSTYHLPHSVDALYLSKAISLYNNKVNYLDEYLENTKQFVNKFINAVLASSNPRKFEGDFKLLIQGLINREHEFRVLINELADWPMAEKIIRNINPGFVIQAFNTRNGHSSEEILEYYNVNIGWLKTSILELYPNQLNIINKRYLDIFKDIFEDTKDLENYLRNNDKIFCDNHILEAISGLGEEYKHVLIDYYEQNKDRLKSSFLELSPVQLLFIYRFFKSDLNIFKDIIKNLKDLYDYLKINDKVFHQAEFIEEISDLGEEYKRVLIDYFEHNIDRLKPSFLELSPVKLYFIYRYFNNYLKHNIFKDIFKDPKDLYDYLKTNEKAFNQNNVLEAVCGLGETYKSVLIDYYKQNTDRLKLSFLKINPVSLSYVYLFFIGHFNYNIIKDIFKDIKDLDDYLKTNCSRLNDIIIRAIGDLGDEYKLVLENYKVNRHGYNYFFSTPKNDYCISGQKIDYYKDSNTPFDITRFENNSFYFYKIDWYDLQRFVKIIHKNMNDDNRQRSIEMVDAIILIVLDKKHSLSYAKAGDLSYFYSNIASVDEELYEKLISNQAVIKDIKYRLSSQKFSLDDLRLFSHFYNEDWFYKNDMTKMVYKASESLNKADEKDLSTSLGSINYTNVNFYNDLITNEIVVGNAKKRFEVFTFSLDNLYLFGHFYSQDWCRRKMNELIDNADEEQQKVIKEWYDKVVDGLKKEEKSIEDGTLLAYIHNKFFNEQQNN